IAAMVPEEGLGAEFVGPEAVWAERRWNDDAAGAGQERGIVDAADAEARRGARIEAEIGGGLPEQGRIIARLRFRAWRAAARIRHGDVAEDEAADGARHAIEGRAD